MHYPKLQLLTDYKSFCNLFEIACRGSWRDLEIDAVYNISHMLRGVEHEVIVYDYVKQYDFTYKEDYFRFQSALFFTNKPLSYFDRFSLDKMGRAVEMNNLDYKTNSMKSELLGRLCFNIEDSNQVKDFLGFLTTNTSGSVVYTKKSRHNHTALLDWSFKDLEVMNSIVIGNSYIDSIKSDKILELDALQLEQELKNGVQNYLRSIFPDSDFKGKYHFYYITKISRTGDFQVSPINIVDALYNRFGYSHESIEDIIRLGLGNLCSKMTLILNNHWHHRKIFSDYFRIVHDDTLGLKRSTTYSIEGILHHYAGYWAGVEELKRHSAGKLDMFCKVKSLKEILAEANA